MDIKIFTGVPIYTLDKENSVVEAVVVLNGKIVFTGNLDEALGKYSYSEQIKLEKGILMPGFIDPHINLGEFANIFRDLDLSEVKSKEELTETIRSYVKNKKEKKWIVGGGVRSNLIDTITRKDLDEASPFNPVLLYSWDFQTAIANTKALEVSGIDDNYQNPMGGVIEKDGSGEITGVLRDRAINVVAQFIDKIDSRKNIKSIESGINKLLSIGITTFCDFSAGSIIDKSMYIRRIMQISKNNRLKSRMIFMVDDKDAEFLNKVGFISQFGSDFLLIGGVKLIIDGTLSDMTAYMKKPYIKSRSNGVLLYSESELNKLVRSLYKNYLWTSIQAVGDAANDIALNVYKKLNRETSIPALLKRIDYAESLSDESIETFVENNVVPVMMPSHIPYLRKKAIDLLSVNARSLFRVGSLIRAGARVAFASDAPVVFPNPLYSIYCAIERKDYDDGPELRFYPKEHVDILDAIKAVTINAAYACGMEDKVGSIEVGKKADIIQLSKDIFNCDTDEIKNVKIVNTFVNGENVSE